MHPSHHRCREFRRAVRLLGIVLWSVEIQAASFYFDGNDDYVFFGDVLDFSGPFTLEAWVLLEPGATGHPPTWDTDIVAKVGGIAGNNGYELAYGVDENPDELACLFNTGGNVWPQYKLSRPVDDIHGCWMHLAGTYDGDTLAVYRNGNSLGSQSVGSQTIADSGSPLMIGANANNMNYWQGWIDEVRIWNVARTEAELRSTMYRSIGGTEPGLIGYWNFDTGFGGDVVHDLSSGGNNGALRNGVQWSMLNSPRAEIWGVKSKGRGALAGSEPPATLFRFNTDGSEFVVVGPVTLAGEEIDVDAMAMSPRGTLLALQVGVGGSRLITIDPESAAATVIGPVLDQRDIRGGAFTISGRLIVADATFDEVLEIDGDTGLPLGQAVKLRLNNLDFDLPDYCDLAQSHDGSLMLGTQSTLYALNIETGEMRLLFQDPNPGAEGSLVGIDGLAFSPIAEDVRGVCIYDISLEDDLYSYDRGAAYSRSLLFRNIIPLYNAGRGDLAALPAGRCEILHWGIEGGAPELRTVCRRGVFAWFEMTEDLVTADWQIVPGSGLLIPETDIFYSFPQTWPALPFASRVGFFRIGTSTKSPTGL